MKKMEEGNVKQVPDKGKIAESLPIWEKLSKLEQRQILENSIYKEVKKGQEIYNTDKDCLGILVVDYGVLRAFISSEDGKQITLYHMLPEDICMMTASCAMKNIQFSIQVEAKEDCGFFIIPTMVYKILSSENLEFSNYCNELMNASFSEVMWLMEEILWHSLDKRLAKFLLDEVVLEHEDLKEGEEVISLTHEQIANQIGSSREVITRMLKHFVDVGLVSLSRKEVRLIDMEGLRKLAE